MNNIVNHIKKGWESISNIGVRPDMVHDTTIRIKIMNQVCVIGILITLAYSVFLLLFASAYHAFFDFDITVILIVALFLMKKTNYKITSIYVFLVVPVGLVLHNFVYGPQGSEYYLFPILILAYFIFRNNKKFPLLLIYLVAMFWISKYLEKNIIPSGLSAVLSNYFYYTSFIAAIILGWMILRIYEREINRHQLEVNAKNLMLEKANNEAMEQNEKIKTLLKELSHRTKNNLQLISSLINIQSKELKGNVLTNHELYNILQDVRTRINSIALVHKNLYLGNSHSNIELKKYVTDLVQSLQHITQLGEEDVSVIINIEAIDVDIDYAVTFGIILNELITNSFEHGISKVNNKELKISINKKDNYTLRSVIHDSGSGIEDLNNNKGGFGIELVNSLVHQLNGVIHYFEDNGNNVEFEVKIV